MHWSVSCQALRLALIPATEGEYFDLSEGQGRRLRLAVERLTVNLRPRTTILRERGGAYRLDNVIGTVDIGGNDHIEVSPKVATVDDWPRAAIWLMTGEETIDVGGDRRARQSPLHNRFSESIAAAYYQRLERAFRQEGPIVLLERASRDLPHLHGKLDVTSWVKHALWRPHIFPVSRTELARDNPFSHGLVRVAHALGNLTNDHILSAKLRALSRDLSPGLTDRVDLLGVESMALPEQWSAYTPAWALAVAVLTRTSLFGPSGTHVGIGVAVEAWPLLETLLERVLQVTSRIGRTRGRAVEFDIKGTMPLLTPLGPATDTGFSPEPDGRLYEDGNLVATFEAKYAAFDGKSPPRGHIYQTLSTAAACGSPTAILVYPGSFETRAWLVNGFGGRPMRLLALGLRMFSWHASSQLDTNAEAVLDALVHGQAG